MRKRFMAALLLFLMGAACGCGQNNHGSTAVTEQTVPRATVATAENARTPEINEKPVEDVKIGWIFEQSTKTDVNGVEVPYTDVSVSINGKKTEIKKFQGTAQEITDFSSHNVPQNTVLACDTWFAGAGANIYVVKSGEKTLKIMYRTVDEEDQEPAELADVKEISFHGKIRINVLQAQTIQTSINSMEQELIGIWNASPSMTAAWNDKYVFFEDKRFEFDYNQADEEKRVIDMSGEWDIVNNQLVLKITEKTVVVGGELGDPSPSASSEHSIVNGTMEKKKIDPAEVMTIPLRKLEKDESSPYPVTIKIGEEQFWKYGDDPRQQNGED